MKKKETNISLQDEKKEEEIGYREGFSNDKSYTKFQVDSGISQLTVDNDFASCSLHLNEEKLNGCLRQ
jgi:hypothetical protein